MNVWRQPINQSVKDLSAAEVEEAFVKLYNDGQWVGSDDPLPAGLARFEQQMLDAALTGRLMVTHWWQRR